MEKETVLMPESNQKAMESAKDIAKGQGKKNMTDKFEDRYVKKMRVFPI